MLYVMFSIIFPILSGEIRSRFPRAVIFLRLQVEYAMTKRDSTIDFLKFFFALIIMLYHFGIRYVQGGYIVVEGFFMISGYFMMRNAAKESATPLAERTAKYLWRKYTSIFPYLLLSALIGFFVYIQIQELETKEALKVLPLLLFEIIPLQIAGFDGYWSTGVSWYLSAMFLAFAVLYPLAVRFRKAFSLIIAPFLAVFVYGILCAHYHALDVPNLWMTHFLNTGFLRAIAGVSLGALIFQLAEKSKNKAPTPLSLVGFSMLNFLCLAMLLFFIRRYSRTAYDFFLVALMFIIILIAFSGKSLLSCHFHCKWSCVFSSLSLVIYLNHFYWSAYLRAEHISGFPGNPLRWYLILVFVSSVVVSGIVHTANAIRRRLSGKKATAEPQGNQCPDPKKENSPEQMCAISENSPV